MRQASIDRANYTAALVATFQRTMGEMALPDSGQTREQDRTQRCRLESVHEVVDEVVAVHLSEGRAAGEELSIRASSRIEAHSDLGLAAGRALPRLEGDAFLAGRPGTDRAGGEIMAFRLAVLAAKIDDLKVTTIPGVLREDGLQIALGLLDILPVA